MSIIIQRPWTVQPQGPVRANWGNPLTRDIQAAWSQFDGAFLDSTGRNNGTLNSGVTRAVGANGVVARFNGTSGKVVLPTPPAGSTLSGLSALSIAVWLYPTSVTGLHNVFNQWPANNGPIVFCNADAMTWQVGPSSNRLLVTSVVTINTWQYFVFTASGSTLKVYKNGALVGSSSPGITNPATVQAAEFGNNIGGTGFWVGDMGTAATWGRELAR